MNKLFLKQTSRRIIENHYPSTLKSICWRVNSLLNLIEILAEKEKTTPKEISAYALQLISNDKYDAKTAAFVKKLFAKEHTHQPALCP